MGVCPFEAEMAVGTAVEKLNAGVAIGCVASGASTNEGVEACSVANRSGVGVEAGRLHPAVKAHISNVKINFVLWMFSFNGFKVALLACQNFCAEAPTIWTGYFFSDRVVFLEASHTLHFGRYKTEVQLRMFRRCAFA
jgi:hypothetical protein